MRIAVVVLFFCGLLVACHAPPPAPIEERVQPPSQKITHHVVSRGETLYAIAWRYELDFVDLAAANGLQPPYELKPGTRLTLAIQQRPSLVRATPVTQPVVTGKSHSVKVMPVPEPGGNKASTPKSSPTPPAVKQPSAVTPPVIASPPTTTSAEVTPPVENVSTKNPEVAVAEPWSWSWPLRGKITREYDTNKVFKGINIFATPGSLVRAAGPGEIVYAGSGLRGYGQLIIVKHDEVYLSAYAQNRRLLVTEGQKIVQGQVVAEMGGDPAAPNRLYFEIRKNGKPVDPLQLLPTQ